MRKLQILAHFHDVTNHYGKWWISWIMVILIDFRDFMEIYLRDPLKRAAICNVSRPRRIFTEIHAISRNFVKFLEISRNFTDFMISMISVNSSENHVNLGGNSIFRRGRKMLPM